MSSSPTTPVKSLIEAADRAHAAGRHHEAAELLAQAQQRFPENPSVLSALGMQALHQSNARLARTYFERAVSADPNAATLWLNLALAYKALGQSDDELSALQRVLAIDPYHSLGLLQRARCLENRGDRKHAAHSFHAFLASLPAGAEQAPAFKSAVAHARQAVKRVNDELFDFVQGKVADLRSEHSSERFDAGLDIMVGRKRVYAQQPTFMNFPHLPAIQFFDRAQFEWLDAIEAATDDIRRELLSVLAEDGGELTPYIQHPQDSPLNQWRELNQSLKWSAYYLWREGQPLNDHLARCPATAAALAHAPAPAIGRHAPTAFFSILKPRTRIPPHTGATNARAVVHLPLIVPPGCGFRVGYDVRQWQPGKAWVFDDTIEHEAWNNSDQIRAILIFDIWNPFLNAAERALVRAAIEAVAEFHGDQAGFNL